MQQKQLVHTENAVRSYLQFGQMKLATSHAGSGGEAAVWHLLAPPAFKILSLRYVHGNPPKAAGLLCVKYQISFRL